MGTVYAKPEFFQIYYELGMEYGIPIMVVNPTPVTVALYRAAGYPLTDDLVRRMRNSKLPKLDVLVTGIEEGHDLDSRREGYYKVLKNLQPGVTQLIVHLAKDDPEIRAITGHWGARYDDFRIFTDPQMQQKLKELNIQVIGWRPIQELMNRQ